MKKVLLVMYGEGGHRTEMIRLLQHLNEVAADLCIVSLGVQDLSDKLPEGSVSAHYPASDIRSKFSRLKTLFLLPTVFSTLWSVARIQRRYKLAGVISTGPGLTILPIIWLRLWGTKSLYVETFCRFYDRSITGRVMNLVANRFLIQNKELQKLYPDGEYCGRL